MRLLFAALLVAATSLSGSQAAQHAPTSQRLQEALQAIRGGHAQRAVVSLETLRDEQPDSATVHHYLGLAYEKQERYSAAIDSLNRALQLDPSRMAALAPLAWSQFYLGRSGEARHSFTRYLAVAPGDPQARLGLGLVEVEDGHPDRARLHFLEAIQLTRAQGDGDNEALARSALADVEMRNGNLLTASRLLEAAIALRPADGALYLKLAHVLDISGDDEGAAAARAAHAKLSEGATTP